MSRSEANVVDDPLDRRPHRREIGEWRRLVVNDHVIDHLERGDINQHPLGSRLGNFRSQVVLKRERELIVHVDLDGDE